MTFFEIRKTKISEPKMVYISVLDTTGKNGENHIGISMVIVEVPYE